MRVHPDEAGRSAKMRAGQGDTRSCPDPPDGLPASYLAASLCAYSPLALRLPSVVTACVSHACHPRCRRVESRGSALLRGEQGGPDGRRPPQDNDSLGNSQ